MPMYLSPSFVDDLLTNPGVRALLFQTHIDETPMRPGQTPGFLLFRSHKEFQVYMCKIESRSKKYVIQTLGE